MRYEEFRRAFADFPVLTLSDIRVVDNGFDRRRLSEWQRKGYIRKIVKGGYVFSEFELNEERLFLIANRIYSPSYISLESALAYYHLIPESIYAVTSISTRRTYEFETPLSRFVYRSLKRTAFVGYDIAPGKVRMAFMEKALLDYFYLHPALQTEDDFESLRINADEFREQLNEARWNAYLSRFGQKALTQRMSRFMEWIRNA